MTFLRHTRYVSVILSTAALVIAAAAWGQQAGKPQLVTTIKVNKPPKEKAKPGEVLTYTITLANRGNGAARDVAIANPVPAHTVYVPHSATGKETRILFSIDGGKNFSPWPVRIRNKRTNKEEEASPDRITHVKWALQQPLAPGKEVVVTYQVRVK